MIRLLERLLPPRSWCSGCGRPWYSDRRRPCRCGATARRFELTARDGVTADDKFQS